MKWTVLLVLGAHRMWKCNGDGTDFAAAYVANWTATGTFVVDGNSQSLEVLVPIQETSTNVIEVQGFCSDTDTYAAGPRRTSQRKASPFARAPVPFQA